MLKYTYLILCLGLFVSACSYTIKIKDGNTAFEQKQFDVATEFLKKEFKKADRRSEKGKIAFKLAESFSKNSEFEKALPWYKTAYDNNYGVEALKQYAYGLKKAERYDEAIENFETLGLEIGSKYEFRKEITACKVAKDWLKIEHPEYQIKQADFNSKYSEFAPTIYKEDQLIISSDKPAATGEETYKWTGRDFMDLFILPKGGGTPKPFSDVLNSEENEGSICFNEDFSECYFTRCGGDLENVSYCKIFYSTFNGTDWDEPILLAFQVGNVNYMHPAISDDGDFLYFACDHPDGWGGFDIYVSERTQNGWDEPRMLSRSINTVGNEMFPTLNADTLYFSSDRLSGMGGLDIFKTYPLNAKQWSPPYNLKPPINSGADDFGFAIDPNSTLEEGVLQKGFFSSSRLGVVGADDIFHFEKVVPPPPPVEPEKPDTTPIEIVYQMILEVYVLEKIYQNPSDPNSAVLGRRPLNAAKVEMILGDKKENFTTDSDGKISIELEEESSYAFFASKPNFLTENENFSTIGFGKDPNQPIQKYELEIVLDKIFKNKEINLENIYYDYDKWDIRVDAKPTLDRLANALQLNPTIKIQMASHTDCRGADRYNQNLSQKRAQSAVDYLIQRGIESSRLSAKGFGESSPAVDCACTRCSESEHQRNRRTTFTILE